MNINGVKEGEMRSGEWADFEAEMLPHLPRLFRIAMLLTRDRARAEDLVQETMIQALQSFQRYQQGTNASAWLVSIMYHMRSHELRAGRRLRQVTDIEERIAATVAFEPPTPQGLTDVEVLRALKRLPQQFQEVVVLADVEDMAYKEIAATIGVPIGTIMSRLHRGRKLLRVELAAYANSCGLGRGDADDSSAPAS
jgi:RNA polymerase sigma-70 factor, ECF subfamily